MTAVDCSRITDAVVALLRAQTGLLVGDGAAPTPADDADTLALRTGYLIVYQVPAGAAYESDGMAGQPESITRARYQICGIGIQRNQAERAAERAIKVLVDRSPTPPRAYLHPLAVTGATVLERVRSGSVPLDTAGGAFSAGGYVDVLASVSA